MMKVGLGKLILREVKKDEPVLQQKTFQLLDDPSAPVWCEIVFAPTSSEFTQGSRALIDRSVATVWNHPDTKEEFMTVYESNVIAVI